MTHHPHAPPSLVYVDIETIPCADPADVPEPKAPANYKDPEKIAAYVAEARADAWRATSLDPLLGRIVAIGVAVDDQPALCFAGGAEDAMIAWLDSQIPQGRCLWIGHNVSAFDLRWLYLRAVKYRSPLRRRIPWEKWDKRIVDTMDLCMGPNPRGSMVGLDKLARYLGLGGKDGDGSMVYDLWQAGNVQAIQDYCRADVELTREVYRALTGAHDPVEVEP